jgi:hypothetical protein
MNEIAKAHNEVTAVPAKMFEAIFVVAPVSKNLHSTGDQL